MQFFIKRGSFFYKKSVRFYKNRLYLKVKHLLVESNFTKKTV